jgi:hypothetical protein
MLEMQSYSGQRVELLAQGPRIIPHDVDADIGVEHVGTRELVAGFWIWEVKDMDEAVVWVKRCPNPMAGPSEIEIRPFCEMADLQ